MATQNLGLEEIKIDDKIKNEFIDKINNNMKKIDDKYGVLVNELIVRTEKDTLEQALSSLDGMYKTDNSTATAEDIVLGKVAYINTGKVVGTYDPIVVPEINITVNGTNSTYIGYITGYGAGINREGVLVIWALSNTTAYEHICFKNTSIGAGTTDKGWNITSFDTGDPASVPYACTIKGMSGYKKIDIELYSCDANSSYDYVTLQVTLTAS